MDGYTDKWMDTYDRSMDGWIERWMDDQKDRWIDMIDEQIDRYVQSQVDRWMVDRQMGKINDQRKIDRYRFDGSIDS